MSLARNTAVFILTCIIAVSLANAQQRVEPLTNASIIKLVRAGFKEKTIIAIIHSRPGKFELDPDRLIELKRNGVNENIILTMLAQEESTMSTADDWTDDSFFREGRKPSNNNDNKQGSADIFGSNGSSKGSTKGRGMSGSTEGDKVTTGSATVRIMRPPAEEGGAPTKLERTPTLNNDAIIRLVDAGFSEGTIIKRIEDSPVEFDISAAKIAELRKHRVSDEIIAAMTAAMGDGSGVKSNEGAKPRQ
jgi:hypothetical protein